MSPTSRVIPLVGVLLAPAIGCGEAESLTKAEYAKRADAICRDYAARARTLDRPESAAEVPRVAAAAKALSQGQRSELGDLRAPAEFSDEAEKIQDLLQAQIDRVDELIDATRRNDQAKIQRLNSEAAATDDQVDAVAASLGPGTCSRG